MYTNYHKDIRKKLHEYMTNNSMLVLFSGIPVLKYDYTPYNFTPSPNFYYSTGIDAPNIVYMCCRYDDNISETIFIERRNELKEKWEGAITNEKDVIAQTGINTIKYLDEFNENIANSISSNRIEKIYFDLELKSSYNNGNHANKAANQILKKYPYIKSENIYNFFIDLRIVKNLHEIKNIKKAINISNDAFKLILRNTASGMYEYEIESYFDFVLKKNGIKESAFNTIVASGINSVILHYDKNSSKTKDGDLVLFDFGAKYKNYSCDITRTFPVNGKFTKRQAQIYNIVLEAQKLVINEIKPGVQFSRLNEIILKYYGKKLKEIGLIDKNLSGDETQKELSRYYFHGVSHLLGLETHDLIRIKDRLLEPGMVITVEPGLYIKEEEIGIRIEDDVVVTETGCEVLSKDIIKTIDEIENYIN